MPLKILIQKLNMKFEGIYIVSEGSSHHWAWNAYFGTLHKISHRYDWGYF